MLGILELVFIFLFKLGRGILNLNLKVFKSVQLLLLGYQSIYITSLAINYILIIGLQHWLYFSTWIKNAFAVGTIRANHLLGFPLSTNKDLERVDRGSSDYCVDCNSGIVIAKWVDNKTVQVASNYVGNEPMRKIKWLDKKLNAQVEVPSTIIQAYNTNMGRVDLVDMLIALYRIKGGTKRWYIKIFWHLINICTVNAWNLYCLNAFKMANQSSKSSHFYHFQLTWGML